MFWRFIWGPVGWTRGEVKTNEGRIDMTAETPEHGYVIEFKLGASAAAAIAQIKANHYADRFAGNGKTLTLVGLAFSKERRTIVDAAVEAVGVVTRNLSGRPDEVAAGG